MISIIIPTKQRPDLLRQCVESIQSFCRKDTGDYEIAVIDTGDGHDGDGIDGAKLWAHIHHEGTFSRACNKGAAHTEGDILLLNNDVIVVNDLTKAFRQAATKHPNAIIGARLLYPDGLVQHAGVGFDNDGGPYNLWKLAPAEHPEVMKRRYLPAVTFACALIPRHIWRELGGLDEGYINAYEDVDFCLRAREASYQVLYDPSVTAIHLEGQSPGRNDNIQASWNHYQDKWTKNGRVFYALGSWPFSVQRAQGGQ